MNHRLYNILHIGSLVCCLLIGIATPLGAQINLRIEQLGETSYKEDGEKTGGKGAPVVTNLEAMIPLSYKMDENKKLQNAWIGLLNTKFTSLHNKDIPLNTSPSEIFNLHFGIARMHRIKHNQIIVYGLVLSMYSSHANMLQFRSRNIFYNIAGAHIWEIHPNLKIGAGGIITMFFGYPLPIPFPYIEWKWGNKYMLNTQFISNPQIKVSMIPRKDLTLSLEYNIRGATAVESINGVKKMFNHSYKIVAAGVSYRYKKIDFYTYLGVDFDRKIKFRDRKLKSFFRHNDTNFAPSPYLSAGVKYNLY